MVTRVSARGASPKVYCGLETFKAEPIPFGSNDRTRSMQFWRAVNRKEKLKSGSSDEVREQPPKSRSISRNSKSSRARSQTRSRSRSKHASTRQRSRTPLQKKRTEQLKQSAESLKMPITTRRSRASDRGLDKVIQPRRQRSPAPTSPARSIKSAAQTKKSIKGSDTTRGMPPKGMRVAKTETQTTETANPRSSSRTQAEEMDAIETIAVRRTNGTLSIGILTPKTKYNTKNVAVVVENVPSRPPIIKNSDFYGCIHMPTTNSMVAIVGDLEDSVIETTSVATKSASSHDMKANQSTPKVFFAAPLESRQPTDTSTHRSKNNRNDNKEVLRDMIQTAELLDKRIDRVSRQSEYEDGPEALGAISTTLAKLRNQARQLKGASTIADPTWRSDYTNYTDDSFISEDNMSEMTAFDDFFFKLLVSECGLRHDEQ